jgi:uncharacterized protein (TIGR02266 family)
MSAHTFAVRRYHRVHLMSWPFRVRRWVQRRLVWTTCGAIALAVGMTTAMVDLVSNVPQTLYDPISGQVTPMVEAAIADAGQVFAGWTVSTFGISAILAFAGMAAAGIRSERRVRPERQPLRVAVHVDGSAGSYEAVSENISIGGLLLATDREHAVGDKVRLRFQLPNQEAMLSIEAEVRWLRRRAGVPGAPPSGLGLLFLSPDWSFKLGLRRFIAVTSPMA